MSLGSSQYTLLLHILILMSEQLGTSIMKNAIQLCSLFRVLLEENDNEETISVVLTLMDVLLSGNEKILRDLSEDVLFL
jgi:hypothetical protein